MERLSEGAIELNDIEVIDRCSYSCYMNLDIALNKLKEYEDLDVTPSEIKCLLKNFGISLIINNRELRSELREYKYLEEQGRLIKLPCKVRDIVYEANTDRSIISTYKITSIVFMAFSTNYNWELLEGISTNLNGFNESALGKTIFLTKEEAEEALNKMGD